MKINLLKLKPKTYVFIIALLSLLSIHLFLNPRPLYEGQVNSGGSGADDANAVAVTVNTTERPRTGGRGAPPPQHIEIRPPVVIDTTGKAGPER